MNGLAPALWSEVLKIRKSRIFWITILASIFIVFMLGFMMFVLKYPEYARKYGLIAAKAAIAGKADWPSFLRILTQTIAGGGLVGFGFIASWIFGREYSDRTAKDLLALPVSRAAIIGAKFIAMGAWCVLLSVLIIIFGFVVGKALGLAGWSTEIFNRGAGTYALTCGLTIMLCTPVAFFACLGRGYLSPLGFVILTIMLAQIVAGLGYGQYFPWAIPVIISRIAGPDQSHYGAASYLILFLTSIAGLIATMARWRYADQT
jgi:ABC-2 type transport system permease protein